MKVNEKYAEGKEYVLERCNKNEINLGIVENFLPTRHKIKDMHKYPVIDDTYEELMKLISNYTKVDTENILLVNGSRNGLQLILKTFTTSCTNILIPIPNYPGFIQDANLSNGNIIFVQFDGTNYDSIIEEIYRADIIYFSTPNMPIGYTLISEKIKCLIEENKDKLFIIDEAYFEYGGQTSFIYLVPKLKNLIVTRTFSKAFALAGARVGYIVAHTDLIKLLRTGYCSNDVNNVSVQLCNDALKGKVRIIIFKMLN